MCTIILTLNTDPGLTLNSFNYGFVYVDKMYLQIILTMTDGDRRKSGETVQILNYVFLETFREMFMMLKYIYIECM